MRLSRFFLPILRETPKDAEVYDTYLKKLSAQEKEIDKLTDKQKDLLREFDRLTNEGGSKHSPQSKGWMDKVKDFFE